MRPPLVAFVIRGFVNKKAKKIIEIAMKERNLFLVLGPKKVKREVLITF